jgi:hypothetical protein
VTISLALLLLVQQPPVAATESATQDEIVVIARKLATSRFTWKADDDSGEWKLKKCKIKKSSGDKEIDAIVCSAIGKCLVTLPPKANKLTDEFNSCVNEKRRELVQELADKKAAVL